MNILGWFLAVCGIAGLVFGLRMMLKGKKIGTVPFRKPSDLAAQGAQGADAKGMVSTEGQAVMSSQPLIAPMSGEPCIGYEVTIERKWEKHVRTEKGMQKKTGTNKIFGEYRGSFFQISDGAGNVLVDATTEPDSEYDKTHSSTMTVGMVIPGTLTFGQLQMNTPTILDHDSRTVAFVGTEKVIKPSGTMYALGQVAQGPQGLALGTPKGIGTGKLIVHHKGREQLVGKTKRNMILGYAIGGVLFLGGVPLGLFGPKAQASTAAAGIDASCPDTITTDVSCSDRMYAASGKDYVWTVTEAATYSIELKQPNVASPIDGVLEVLDATGSRVAYDDGGSADKNAHIVQELKPGTYKLNVRDFAHDTVEGGYGYALVIAKQAAPVAAADPKPALAPTAAAAAVGTAHTSSAHVPAAAAKPAAAKPGKHK